MSCEQWLLAPWLLDDHQGLYQWFMGLAATGMDYGLYGLIPPLD